MKEDLCLYYVREAVQLADGYEQITAEEYFYEEAGDKTATNTKIQKGVIASLKKALDAILTMISDITTKVSNMVQRVFMSKEQKELFDKYEARLKANPETANMKVKVADFKKLDAAYSQALRDAEKAAKEGADPSVGEQIMAVLKKNLDKIVIGVGVMAALQLCKNSKNVARGISGALEKEEGLVKALQNKIGKEATDDLKAQTKKYSKDTFWSRFKVNLFKHKQETFASKLKTNMGVIASCIPGTKASKDPKYSAKKLELAADVISNPTGAKVAAGGLRAAAKVQSVKSTFNTLRGKN